MLNKIVSVSCFGPGPGPYFDLAGFSFHTPDPECWPSAVVVAAKKASTATKSVIRPIEIFLSVGIDAPQALHESVSQLGEDFFCHRHRVHGRGPTGVKRQVCDFLDEFWLLDSVFESSLQVKPQLVGAIQSNQRRHGDETAVTFGKFFALPDVSEEHIVG